MQKVELKLGNLVIKENKCYFEYIYEAKFIDEKNIQFYAENEKKEKYLLDMKKSKFYIDEDNKIEAAKVELCLDISNYGKYAIFMNNNGKISKCYMRNNRGQVLVPLDNKFVIFYGKSTLEINENLIQISSRKFGDKFKYELFKLIYGIKKYKKIFLLRFVKRENKYFLFNDRLNVVDDNSFALFEYINKNQKQFAKKCYFVLSKDSKDVEKVKKVGKVLYYGTLKHKIKYIKCNVVSSSHTSYFDPVYNPFNLEEMDMYKDILTKKLLFTQHGIIMNGVHCYLSRERTGVDRIVASTYGEYDSLLGSEYMYEKEMVIKTGLARFDKLENKKDKMIFISPTWRADLIDVEDIKKTEYYKKYERLFNNKDLLNCIEKNDYKIVFLLHPNFLKYKSDFLLLKRDRIKIVTADEIKYNSLFNSCSFLITDYSSIHYDVAYLKKPIIYYQDDKAEFFGKHYKKGYFSYENDGFGDVIEDGQKLVLKIISYIENDCKIEEKYLKKIKDTFFYLDKNNSRRVYEEILKLSDEKSISYRFSNVA